MPGPQDQLHEPRNPDQARPLERDPTRADLRERLERLPPNHPSSPYNDDGSRKSPEPATREFPIPGDPDYHPETSTDRPLPTDDAPRIKPDGSWEWHGRYLTPERLRAGDEVLARCVEAEGRDAEGNYGEHGLTPAMRRVEASLEHGHLVDKTEEFALKSPDRFREKLAALSLRFPNSDPMELATSIHDAIRYTFILDFDEYTETVEVAQRKVEEAGYERIETRPGWNGDEYKGVNSQWGDPASGLRFEIQFHTQESWEAKQTTHDAYRKIDLPGVSVQEAERLRAFQREVSARVHIPHGALDIPAYQKGLT